MRWNKPNIRGGMHSLLGKSSPALAMDRDAKIETIRDAMMSCLGPLAHANNPQCLQVMTRLRFSNDVEDLWYLRGDVMALLSAQLGELAARDSVDALTPLFEGLLPRSMTARTVMRN